MSRPESRSPPYRDRKTRNVISPLAHRRLNTGLEERAQLSLSLCVFSSRARARLRSRANSLRQKMQFVDALLLFQTSRIQIPFERGAGNPSGVWRWLSVVRGALSLRAVGNSGRRYSLESRSHDAVNHEASMRKLQLQIVRSQPRILQFIALVDANVYRRLPSR